MESQVDAELDKNERRGRNNYRNLAKRHPAPKHPQPLGTVLDTALHSLFPWGAGNYPGFIKAARAAIANVPANTLKDWRRGRRKTPMWALDLVSLELDKRRAAIDHAQALIKKEKAGI